MPNIDQAAQRVARLLAGGATELSDARGSELEFLPSVELRPLERGAAPPDCWAVDGGQSLVADARCLQVVATRAARTRWQAGHCTLEDEGELRAHVLAGSGGGTEGQLSLAELASPVAPGSPVDINLLRDWAEWQLVARCAEEADPGAVVLVDGDLQPDWRIPAHWLAGLLARAAERGVALAGVTKHSSLARGGAPLVGQLELEAERLFGPRGCWWAPIARSRTDLGPGLLVVVARLDPDARFAFRVDLPAPAGTSAVPDQLNDEAFAGATLVLGQLAALADDAAFPGYPYPLSVADRLAACPGWVRAEVWSELESALELAGLPEEVRERAFADRHALMERA